MNAQNLPAATASATNAATSAGSIADVSGIAETNFALPPGRG